MGSEKLEKLEKRPSRQREARGVDGGIEYTSMTV